jgi:hypothetical protein
MSTSSNSFLKTIGPILYGLVAGFAATVVIVLGCIFLGLLSAWAFNSLGWKQLGDSALVAGLSSVYFTVVIGLIVGLVVWYKVSTTRLRQQSAQPKANSR